MILTAVQLLRALGSGIRPAGGEQPAAGAASFAEMLESAKAGTVSSGLAVEVAPDAGVNLTNDQLARVAQAADRAEASGAHRALVEIDGQRLMLDVASRTVTGHAAEGPGGVVTGVDAVIRVPDAGQGQSESRIVPLPWKGNAASARSIQELLAGLGR